MKAACYGDVHVAGLCTCTCATIFVCLIQSHLVQSQSWNSSILTYCLQHSRNRWHRRCFIVGAREKIWEICHLQGQTTLSELPQQIKLLDRFTICCEQIRHVRTWPHDDDSEHWNWDRSNPSTTFACQSPESPEQMSPSCWISLQAGQEADLPKDEDLPMARRTCKRRPRKLKKKYNTNQSKQTSNKHN